MWTWAQRCPEALFVALSLAATGVFLLVTRLLALGGEAALALSVPVVFTPLVAALFVNQVCVAPSERAAFGQRFARWQVGLRWYLVALLFFPAVATLTLGLRLLVDGTAPPSFDPPALGVLLGQAVPLFLVPGLAEEPGWRGFLQPRLAHRWGPFRASLGVGVVWGLWHAQSLAVDPERYAGAAFLLFFALLLGTSCFLGWVGERTGNGVPIAMTGHFGANAVFSWFPLQPDVPGDRLNWILYAAAVWAVVLVLWAVAPPRQSSRASRDSLACSKSGSSRSASP